MSDPIVPPVPDPIVPPAPVKVSWFRQAILNIWAWLQGAWHWLETWTQFLDGPAVNGVSKFSHKRLIALAATVVGIIELFRENWLEAAGCAAVAVILAVVSAVTRT